MKIRANQYGAFAVKFEVQRLSTLDGLLWGAGFIGHLALLLVLAARGRVKSFPIFTSLIAYQAVETVLLFFTSIFGSAHQYVVEYWVLAPGDYIFQIALVFEISRIVLRPTGSWIRDARSAFLSWSIAGTVVAAVVSLALTPRSQTGLHLWGARIEVFTSLLTCMVFLAMSAAANRLGLLWRSQVMALGQGLTAWALTDLFSNVVEYAVDWRSRLVLPNHFEMIVYLGTLAFWIVSFAKSEPELVQLSPFMQGYLSALQERAKRELSQPKRRSGSC